MADDKTDRGPKDRTRIALGEDYEVQYWTGKFGVSRERLEEAVKAVGNSADSVQQHLKNVLSLSVELNPICDRPSFC